MAFSTYGLEYFWESGAYVLYLARPQDPFPASCDIYNVYTGKDELGRCVGYADQCPELLFRMRDAGVPIIDNLNQIGKDGKAIMIEVLSRNSTKEERDAAREECKRRRAEIEARILEGHLQRHPEQRGRPSDHSSLMGNIRTDTTVKS